MNKNIAADNQKNNNLSKLAFTVTALSRTMIHTMKGDGFLQKKGSWMISSLSREQQRSRQNDLGLNQGPPEKKDRGRGDIRVAIVHL